MNTAPERARHRSDARPEVVLASVAARPVRRLGLLEGKLVLPEDFDPPLPAELLASFGYEQ